jgi:predicted nucleic acid-binding protein
LKGGGLPEERGEVVDEDASPQREPLCILDAVICVHFVGANLHRLLIDVLRQADLRLLVPQEVCDEISGKDKKFPGVGLRWNRLAKSQYIQVLPRLEAVSAPARAVEVFEEVRERQFEDAYRDPRDLGEAVVVAHGVHQRDLGNDVWLAIDDQGGRAIAAARGLQLLSIEDVLTMAVAFGKFDTDGDLKDVYGKLRKYGEGLVPYNRTDLAIVHKEWKEQSKTQQ